MSLYRKAVILLTYVLLFIFVMLIFGYGFVNWDVDSVFVSAWSVKKVIILSTIGMCAYFFLARKLQVITNRYVIVTMSILAVLIQFFLVFRYPLQPGWDDTNTLTTAIGIITGNKDWIDTYYFQMVWNQRLFLLVTIVIIRMGLTIGVPLSKLPLLCSCISVIGLDIGLLLACQSYARIRGKEAGRKLFILMLICPGIYLWSGYYYTTNQSVLLISLSFWIVTYLWEREAKTWHYILLGAVGMFGIQYRATQAVFWIAVFIIATVFPPKRFLHLAVGFIIGAVSLCFIMNFMYKSIIPDYEGDVRLPFTHWLMMAAQGNGEYNAEDVNFSESFTTYQERNKADIEKYTERLKSYGVTGTLKLAARKIFHNWGYGDHAYYPQSQRYDRIFDGLWGNNSVFSKWCQQSYHLFLYFAMVVAVLIQLILLIKTNQFDRGDAGILICALFYLGAILFYILWETNPYASVGFLPFLMILAQEGIHTSDRLLVKLNDYLNPKMSGLSVITCLLVIGFAIWIIIVSPNPYSWKEEPVVTQEKVNDIVRMNGGELFSADFVANRDFDQITIWLTKEKRKEESGAIYEISLSGDKRGVIYSGRISGNDIMRTISYLIDTGHIAIEEPERFEITVKTLTDDTENPMEIPIYSGPINPYPDGRMRQGDRNLAGYPYIRVVRQKQ
ncbi:MAG: hypothetical protein K6E75_01030 [Lachnospiraceae bacterium]|nr:hypothetical protein [Lachnospiraceae bacterium]